MREITFSVMSNEEYALFLQAFEQQHIYVNLVVIPWQGSRAKIVKFVLYKQGPDISELGNIRVSSLASMDAVLAILVWGTVIIFGALISAGNERLRRALDGIREQAPLWAMQDLRLKREKLAREVKVDNPVVWFNQVVAKVYRENLDLTVTEMFDNSQALVCTSRDGIMVEFSLASPDDIRHAPFLVQKIKMRLP